MDDISGIDPGASAAAAARTRAAVHARASEPHRSTVQTTSRAEWIDRGALALVYAVSVFSLVGFATFGRHPERLAGAPLAAAVYGWMLLLAPRVQILVAFAALAVVLTRHTGVRWIPACVALYVLSLASELSGTTLGLPFGPYHYTAGLGTKWFGHVPLLIPLSWFFMALPSYAVARRRFPGERQLVQRVLAGSLLLLSWDLVLDPAMSLATSFWVWGTAGSYYGMPLLNLAGWYVTGLVLMVALAWLRIDDWISRLSLSWQLGFYGANLLLPLGMSVVAGLWGAAVTTAIALGLCWRMVRPLAVREGAASGAR
ncbi:MAG TPA: carotenoid biosynthesis protein [Gemmatimonadaceae bacterium]